MSILKEMGAVLKEVLAPKIPAIMQSGYHIGARVEYIDPAATPTHYGTVIRTWKDRVNVQFDGFELGTWLETDTIRRYGQ